MGTREQRNTKLTLMGKTLEVNVCGNIVKETSSERLLGLTVENDLSWTAYLHGNGLKGDQKTVGLLGQLSQRLGTLKKLKCFMLPTQFNSVAKELFGSKLSFGNQVFGNVWGIPSSKNLVTWRRNLRYRNLQKMQFFHTDRSLLRISPVNFWFNSIPNLCKTTYGNISLRSSSIYRSIMVSNAEHLLRSVESWCHFNKR
jgi:hypothetical protein